MRTRALAELAQGVLIIYAPRRIIFRFVLKPKYEGRVSSSRVEDSAKFENLSAEAGFSCFVYLQTLWDCAAIL